MHMTGRRRSIRLRDYDYSTPGAYFVTICTAGREPILWIPRFRDIVNGAWTELSQLLPTLELDDMVIMPDHVHFVVWLLDASGSAAQGASRRAPTLADVVRAFKGDAARRINQLRQAPGAPIWQRNYYEHIVRNARELERIREYIRDNPHMAHGHDDGEDVAKGWAAT